MNLHYYTHAAIEELNNTVHDRIEWYYSPDSHNPVINFRSAKPVRDTNIDLQPFANRLQQSANKPSDTDSHNAMVVYTALQALTPHQASDERLWTYLTHHECPQYVSARWLSNRKRPSQEVDVVKRAQSHFFVRGNRGLTRDNGLSRLWWLGHIAHRIEPGNPRRFLDVLLHFQDVRSALIERPSTSMNAHVLRGIYAVMRRNFEDENKTLFRRDPFREWMKNLNRRGGMVLLDALSDEQLSNLLNQEAARALRSTP